MEGIWQEVSKWLDDRAADIGFLSYQEGMPYEFIPLAEDPMLAVLPRDHPLANAECYPLENCKYDRFIMPALGCDDDIEALFTQNGIEPNVQFTTLESFSVMSMVEQGLGMSIMNQLITEKRICDIAMLHKGKLVLCEEKDRLLEEYALARLSHQRLADLPEDSVVGVENDPYGVRALVRRDMVPHDLPLEHTNLEDIILFLAKGGTRK